MEEKVPTLEELQEMLDSDDFMVIADNMAALLMMLADELQDMRSRYPGRGWKSSAKRARKMSLLLEKYAKKFRKLSVQAGS